MSARLNGRTRDCRRDLQAQLAVVARASSGQRIGLVQVRQQRRAPGEQGKGKQAQQWAAQANHVATVSGQVSAVSTRKRCVAAAFANVGIV